MLDNLTHPPFRNFDKLSLPKVFSKNYEISENFKVSEVPEDLPDFIWHSNDIILILILIDNYGKAHEMNKVTYGKRSIVCNIDNCNDKMKVERIMQKKGSHR